MRKRGIHELKAVKEGGYRTLCGLGPVEVLIGAVIETTCEKCQLLSHSRNALQGWLRSEKTGGPDA